MFDLVNGLPLHPLVVHAVVVLLPLAALGTLVVALRPRWRTRYGPLVVAVALVATVLCPVATASGEALEKRVGDPGRHADLGGVLVWFAIPLVVLSVALVWLQHRHDTRPADAEVGVLGSPRLVAAVAALAVVAALAATVQVYRVGDSGARVVWGNVPAPATGG